MTIFSKPLPLPCPACHEDQCFVVVSPACSLAARLVVWNRFLRVQCVAALGGCGATWDFMPDGHFRPTPVRRVQAARDPAPSSDEPPESAPPDSDLRGLFAAKR